jgi:membrane protein implicated in regulation of membrane protease activity
MAMARSGFSVATGIVIGVPVYLVWMRHDTWAAAFSEWSVALVLVLALAVASLLLGRAVAAGNRR